MESEFNLFRKKQKVIIYRHIAGSSNTGFLDDLPGSERKTSLGRGRTPSRSVSKQTSEMGSPQDTREPGGCAVTVQNGD